MKRLLALAVLAAFTIGTSQANPMHHRTHSHNHGAPNWIAPIVIGGVLGYALAQPRVVVASPPPVYYPPAPVPPYGYHYETIVDAGCNCYRTVLVPN